VFAVAGPGECEFLPRRVPQLPASAAVRCDVDATLACAERSAGGDAGQRGMVSRR
jgi:hypothetical protein